MEHAADTGLLILRIFLGLLMVAHGSQKLFGWLNGYGVAGTGEYFESIGYPSGKLMAVLAALVEAGGGAAFAAGFLTPVVSLIFIALFVNVAWAGHGHTFWNHNQPFGIEYPLVLGVLSATFAYTGPGRYSLDSAMDWSLLGPGWFTAAVGIGLVAGLGGLALKGRPKVASAGSTADSSPEEAAHERPSTVDEMTGAR